MARVAAIVIAVWVVSGVVVGAARAAEAGAPARTAGPAFLVSEQLSQREQAYRQDHGLAEDARPPEVHMRSLMPAIRIISPADDTAMLQPPLQIEIAFDTSDDAQVLPASLRVSYGFLKVDMTRQWRKLATITPRGMVIRNVSVPSGTHWFVIRITDDHGRTAERSLRVRVSG